MKRPLVAIVLFYAAGLLLAKVWQPSLEILFIASFTLLLLAFTFKHVRFWLIWPLLALLGWTNLACRLEVISPNDLRALMNGEARLVTVRGKLAETPSQRVYVRDEVESWRTLACLNVTALADQHQSHWQPAVGQIIVATPGKLPPGFFAGQKVETTGILAPPPLPVAEGLFDYRAYLWQQGIYFQLKAYSTNDWKLLSTNTTPPLSDRFLAWSQKNLARGLPEVDESLKLLWAMTLGWRPALTGEVSAPFMQTGTMHIFAISGLHIALIAGILAAILRALQLPRFWCGMMIIPLIWFYTAATGWQPSAIRSTIMMTIIIGGWMLKRPGNLLNSLAAAALIILLYDPQQLFQASFQLSFFVVLSIALLMPPLEKWRDKILEIDPMLPRELLPRWKRWLNAILRVVLTWLAVSFAAWLGSWPLCAYYFHIFSPVTLLANLLIVPLSSAALACNLGSLICGAWFPWATELFNHSGWLWMKLMLEISHALARWPGAFFYVRSPTTADFIIYYGAVFAVLSGVAFKKQWRRLALICLVFIAGFYSWRWRDACQTTTLTILPLNGGSAVFVREGKTSQSLLIDCGDTNSVAFITTPFLHAQGINHLPRLVLTHGDIRDIGGAQPLCETFSVDTVLTSSVRFRSPIYRQTLARLDPIPGAHLTVNRGDAINVWKILHPSATNNFPQADDNALVLKGEIHGLKILLLSDLGRPGQEELFNGTNDLSADIVVTGLPEKSEPLNNALLEKIRPHCIIVTDSEFPATKRAPVSLRERLAQSGLPVIFTRDSGAVTVEIKPSGWRLRTTMDGQTLTPATLPRSPKQTSPEE